MISTKTNASPQVFLSFASTDRPLADRVDAALTKAGLTVVRMDGLGSKGEYTDVVRSALNESDAVVVALSGAGRRQDIPASVIFEIGAAMGAEKHIYVVVEESTNKLPFSVRHLEMLPFNRVNEIADKLCVGI
jgi:nucleoside 2-deoxyribosyltransferase